MLTAADVIVETSPSVPPAQMQHSLWAVDLEGFVVKRVSPPVACCFLFQLGLASDVLAMAATS